MESLKPQDVFVACQLAIAGRTNATHEWLGKTLHLSPSTVYEALKRCRHSKLVTGSEHGIQVVPQRLFEFLVHAVPVIYYPRRVAPVRGIPTASFSPAFRDRFTKSGDLVTVWPYSKGKEMGEGLLPIYPSIPIACSQNAELYQMMSTIEILRSGKTREIAVATTYLANLLGVEKQISESPEQTEVSAA